jgi:amidase
VPAVPSSNAWNPIGVLGPLARSVEDAALLLRAMAGPDPRAPLSLDDPPEAFVLGAGVDPRGCASPGAATSATCPSSPR